MKILQCELERQELLFSSAMNSLKVIVTGFTAIQLDIAGYALFTATCSFEERELLSCLLCTLSNSEADNGKHIFSSKLRSSNKLDKNTCDGSNNV